MTTIGTSKLQLVAEPKEAPKLSGTNIIPHDVYVEEKIQAGFAHNMEDQVRSLLYRYQPLFCHDPTKLHPARLEPFDIITSDEQPVHCRLYRASPGQKKLIEIEVDKLLQSRVIEPSESDYAAPVVMVKKKDGTNRLCVDYRRLNKKILNDKFPLPLVEENLADFKDAVVFSVLDMRSGYHQIPLTEKAKRKTAFQCHLGLFNYTVLPFGLVNAPAGFKRRLSKLLGRKLPPGSSCIWTT